MEFEKKSLAGKSSVSSTDFVATMSWAQQLMNGGK